MADQQTDEDALEADLDKRIQELASSWEEIKKEILHDLVAVVDKDFQFKFTAVENRIEGILYALGTLRRSYQLTYQRTQNPSYLQKEQQLRKFLARDLQQLLLDIRKRRPDEEWELLIDKDIKRIYRADAAMEALDLDRWMGKLRDILMWSNCEPSAHGDYHFLIKPGQSPYGAILHHIIIGRENWESRNKDIADSRAFVRDALRLLEFANLPPTHPSRRPSSDVIKHLSVWQKDAMDWFFSSSTSNGDKKELYSSLHYDVHPIAIYLIKEEQGNEFFPVLTFYLSPKGKGGELEKGAIIRISLTSGFIQIFLNRTLLSPWLR